MSKRKKPEGSMLTTYIVLAFFLSVLLFILLGLLGMGLGL